MARPELQREIESLLAEAGIPWEIKQGGAHKKIFVGPILAGIIPSNGRAASKGGEHAAKNTIAQIRRAVRRVKDGS